MESGIVGTSIHCILTNVIMKCTNALGWVSHFLKEQKKEQVQISQLLLTHYKNEDKLFFDRIITTDEIGHAFLSSKWSHNWICGPVIVKVHLQQSKVKQMLISSYDATSLLGLAGRCRLAKSASLVHISTGMHRHTHFAKHYLML